MTRLRCIARRANTGRPDDGDGERGSMAILMMVMLVGLMLSSTLVPMIITQDRTTRFDKTRVQALNAAQAGIDVTLGVIRGAVDSLVGAAAGVTWGNSSRLPCTTSPALPLTGTVNAGGAGVASYSVVVEYFMLDPVTEPAFLLGTRTPDTMDCAAGGPSDPISGETTPRYARITSTGKVGTAVNGSTAGRTLTATYVFRTANISLLGGTVKMLFTGLCMDVGSPTAPSQTPLVLQPCSTSRPPTAQQVFAYRTDLTLQLVASATKANPEGLCLNYAPPAKSGDVIPVTLNQCVKLGLPPLFTEQWSYNDLGRYQAANADSADTGLLPDLCMDVAAQASSQPVILRSACGGSGSSWEPSASVGPGAAGLPEWISYKEFGRCMDVPGLNVNAPSLMLYPCKQNPYPQALLWNQVFQSLPIPAGKASVASTLSTIFNRGVPGYPAPDNKNYCITSPGGAATPAWVGVSECAAGSELQLWTLYGGDKSLTYSQKYTIVSTKGGLCIAVGPDDNTKPWSGLIAKKCDGGPDQKWNVDPSLLNVTLKNIREK